MCQLSQFGCAYVHIKSSLDFGIHWKRIIGLGRVESTVLAICFEERGYLFPCLFGPATKYPTTDTLLLLQNWKMTFER